MLDLGEKLELSTISRSSNSFLFSSVFVSIRVTEERVQGLAFRGLLLGNTCVCFWEEIIVIVGTLLTSCFRLTCYHLLLSTWSFLWHFPMCVINAPQFRKVWFNNTTLWISSQYLRIHTLLSNLSQWLILGNIRRSALQSFLYNRLNSTAKCYSRHTSTQKPTLSFYFFFSFILYVFLIWRLSLPYCH